MELLHEQNLVRSTPLTHIRAASATKSSLYEGKLQYEYVRVVELYSLGACDCYALPHRHDLSCALPASTYMPKGARYLDGFLLATKHDVTP